MESKNNGVQKRIEGFADLFLNNLDYSPAFAEANDRIRAVRNSSPSTPTRAGT